MTHLKVFGCKCFILNNGKEQLGKFDDKTDEGIFLGYVTHSHAYRVYNKRLMIVGKSMHVEFNEINPKLQDQGSKNADDEDMLLEKQSGIVNQSSEKEKQSTETTVDNNLPKEWIEPKVLSKDNIIDDINQGESIRGRLTYYEHVAFVSQIESKNVNDSLSNSNWVIAMHNELNEFTRNYVWSLIL